MRASPPGTLLLRCVLPAPRREPLEDRLTGTDGHLNQLADERSQCRRTQALCLSPTGVVVQRAAEHAREAAEAKARQKAEADAKAKQKTETTKPKTDPKAKQKADAEAARLAKEEEEAKAQLAKKPEDDPVKREARRRAVLDQVRRIQQEQMKKGDAFW